MRPFLFALLLLSTTATSVSAQRIEIPRRHDKPPGLPISAEEAIKKMTVPEGFSVEIVAAEPDVVNPVGMAIDERGRFWVTESFEYPRRSSPVQAVTASRCWKTPMLMARSTRSACSSTG